MGSLVANEVVKLVTEKYTPIQQWKFWSDFSVHPKEKPKDIGSSSDIGKLFGIEYESKLKSSRGLMVGCGAIGCELLKNFSRLGISVDGQLIVTDPDHIEVSNLSRQFLFRPENIRQSKSEVAVERINKMTPDHLKMKLLPIQEKLGRDNQALMDKILKETDFVFNALDNVKARLYVDDQCVNYQLPLFESGTLGNKGNTQPSIPFITENYGASKDPEDNESFPVCTLKNFPNKSEHTIHWARDNFEGLFNRLPSNLESFQKDNTFYQKLSGYEKNLAKNDIYQLLKLRNPSNWRQCAIWSIDLWNQYFRNPIIQLLKNFPEHSLTKEGKLFWSAGKRCPKVFQFDYSNSNHLLYIESCTHLLARCFGIKDNFSSDELIDSIKDYKSPEYQVTDGKTATTDEEAKDQDDNQLMDITDEQISQLIGLEQNYVFNSQEFEKDDDTNWHVAYLTATSNCRSQSYGISILNQYQVRGMAGKIIPAVVTTTSFVSGLICLEFLKYISGKKLEDYRSYFANLALNHIVPTEPAEPKKEKIGNLEISVWDNFKYQVNSTLREFVDTWNKKFNVSITMVLVGSSMIYAEFLGNDNMEKSLVELMIEQGVSPFEETIEIIVASDGDEELPTILFSLEKDNQNKVNLSL